MCWPQCVSKLNTVVGHSRFHKGHQTTNCDSLLITPDTCEGKCETGETSDTVDHGVHLQAHFAHTRHEISIDHPSHTCRPGSLLVWCNNAKFPWSQRDARQFEIPHPHTETSFFILSYFVVITLVCKQSLTLQGAVGLCIVCSLQGQLTSLDCRRSGVFWLNCLDSKARQFNLRKFRILLLFCVYEYTS